MEDGKFVKVRLTRGQWALVDLEDYQRVKKYSWQAKTDGILTKGYRAQGCVDGKLTYMHRFILGDQVRKGLQVDHINHNTLDNRRSNLRICNQNQNQWNKMSHSGRDCKGVFFEKRTKHWQAKIQTGKPSKTLWSKTYKTKQEAMDGYDEMATKLFGDFALTNEKIKNLAIRTAGALGEREI